MSNFQIVADRFPSSPPNSYIRFNVIDNNDGTCTVYLESRPNSDAVSTAAAVQPVGLQIGAGGGGTVTGSGTPGTLAVWTDTDEIGDSLISESGGVVTVGGILTVDDGAGAGVIILTEGTAPALAADSFAIYAPVDVAAGGLAYVLPGAAATGFLLATNAAGVMTITHVGFTGTGNVVRDTSPTITGTLTAGIINASGDITTSSDDIFITNLVTNHGYNIGAGGSNGGMFFLAAGQNGFSAGSTYDFIINGGTPGIFRLRSSTGLGWSSSDNANGAASDVALARDGAGVIQVNNGTGNVFRDIKLRNILSGTGAGAYYQLPAQTVAQLTAAATAGAGALAFVTDATLTAITGLGLAVTGGGANKVPVYSDGTDWIII